MSESTTLVFASEARFVSVQGRPEALSREASIERVANVLASIAELSPALANWHDVDTGQKTYPEVSPANELELTAGESGFDWWGSDGTDVTLHIHVGSDEPVFGNYVTLRPVPEDNWGVVGIQEVLATLAASFEAESGMFGSATLGHELEDPRTDGDIWPSWMVFVSGKDQPRPGAGYHVRRADTGWILGSDAFDFEPATLESVKALTAEARRYVIRERSQR